MDSRATEGNAIIGTLLAICVIIVGLRVYVRLVLSKSFGVDDALLVVALVRTASLQYAHVVPMTNT